MATWSGVYLLSISWMPLIIGLSLGLMENPSLKKMVITALAFGCQLLSGEFQCAAFTAIFVFIMFLFEKIPLKRRLTVLAYLAGAAAIASLLAMPQVLPAIDLLEQSSRASGIELTDASQFSFHPLRLIEFAAPNLLGNPIDRSNYLGSFMNDDGDGIFTHPWMISPYFGSLSIGFILVSIFMPTRQYRRRVRWIAVLGLIAMLIALGRHTPVFEIFYTWMPGANFFRYPAKYFSIVALAASVLGAVGLDSLVQNGKRLGDKKNRARFYLVGAINAALVIVLFACIPAIPWFCEKLSPYGLDVEQVQSTVRGSLLGGASVLLFFFLMLYISFRLKPSLLGPCSAICLTGQILWFNSSITDTTTPDLYTTLPSTAKFVIDDTPKDQPVRLMQFYIRTNKKASPQIRGALHAMNLTNNFGSIFGIGYPGSYSASSVGEKHEFWKSTQSYQKQTMDTFSIRHLLVDQYQPVPDYVGFQLAKTFADGKIRIFRNPRALPHVHPVRHVKVVATFEDALANLKDPNIYLSRSAVIQGIESPTAEVSPGPPPGSCSSNRPKGSTIEISCNTSENGWAIINESHHSNWSATLDGTQVPIRRANAIVMGISLPAGNHDIILTYRESKLLLGTILAAIGLLICIVITLSIIPIPPIPRSRRRTTRIS
ncbi:MAG: YfhO family protein [Deltaproteobacteria bacterium]|nr:YfhO family protein [Deltaproteobacteria bacterium]